MKKLMLLLILGLLFVGAMSTIVSATVLNDVTNFLAKTGESFGSNPQVWIPIAAFFVIGLTAYVIAVTFGVPKGISTVIGFGLGLLTALIIPQEIWILLATSYAAMVFSIFAIVPFAALAWFTFDIVGKERSKVLNVVAVFGWIIYLLVLVYIFGAFEALAKVQLPEWFTWVRVLLGIAALICLVIAGYGFYTGVPAVTQPTRWWGERTKKRILGADLDVDSGIQDLENAVARNRKEKADEEINKAIKKFTVAMGLTRSVRGEINKITDATDKTNANAAWAGVRTSLNRAIREARGAKGKEKAAREPLLDAIITHLKNDSDGAMKMLEGLIVILRK